MTPIEPLTIIHQYCIDEKNIAGGIDTWIRDYLFFSNKEMVVIGTFLNVTHLQEKNINYFGVMRKAKRKNLPISLLFALRLIKHRNIMSNNIQLHRIDYVFLLKILKRRSHIDLYLHTDSNAMLMKNSDSKWKYLRLIFKIYEKIALMQVDRLFVYSATDYSRIATINNKAKLMKSWYNDSIFRNLEHLRDSNRVIWVGRFEKPKDPEMFFEIAKRFQSIGNREINFEMIGNGSLFESIASRIENEKIQNLQIIDSLPALELAEKMNQSKVLVSTSLFEGSPRLFYEAIGCGMLIVSALEGDPDGVSSMSEYGVSVSSRQISSYMEAIQKAILQQVKFDRKNLRPGSVIVNQEIDQYY